MRKVTTGLVSLATAVAALCSADLASGKASQLGWPEIDGLQLLNAHDADRPLDGRPGQDIFGGTDPSYSCNGIHRNSKCLQTEPPEMVTVVPADIGHNKLLGGHGNDSIYAGPNGDVIWGDYKPSDQPSSQRDQLFGGAGNDFIYASHGRNEIHTGGGRDTVKVRFGRGEVHCDSDDVLVYVARTRQGAYRLNGCSKITYATEKDLRECSARVKRRHPDWSALRRWKDCERRSTEHVGER
jgi:Ca2+-binding RTX toxin-like protein